jgi:hypothetical protein
MIGSPIDIEVNHPLVAGDDPPEKRDRSHETAAAKVFDQFRHIGRQVIGLGGDGAPRQILLGQFGNLALDRGGQHGGRGGRLIRCCC